VSESTTIRQAVPNDARALSALYRAERAFLAPFEPDRGESFFTEATQRVRLAELAERRRAGAGDAWVILDDGQPAGVISLSNIVRGPFQSANIGYFVAQHRNGRGVATTAVRLVVKNAFTLLGLHRLEAGTLVDNRASQRVLEKAGFERIGLARRYLHIAGDWRDHILFQRLSEDR
jgi:ribosomal-protein-alanine N-acetyltransferase